MDVKPRDGDRSSGPRLHGLDAIRSWPDESRQPASWVIHVHHEPDEVSETELVWHRVEPWERVVATREFEERHWPIPHTVSIRSEIRYDVPPEAVDALERSDLQVTVDRDAGLVVTVGPDLRTNMLTLNLMHDVVTGAATADEAARRYAAATTAPPDGSPPEGMVKCRFDDVGSSEPAAVPPSDPGSTDRPVTPNPAARTVPPAKRVHAPVSTSQPSDREPPPRDTDGVSDRTLTRRHGRDVDEAARRSSGFDLDDRRDRDDEPDGNGNGRRDGE